MRPQLTVIAGRPVRRLPPDLKAWRAPRQAHVALAAAATLRMLATVALALLAGWLMIGALFSLDTTPAPAANDARYEEVPR